MAKHFMYLTIERNFLNGVFSYMKNICSYFKYLDILGNIQKFETDRIKTHFSPRFEKSKSFSAVQD